MLKLGDIAKDKISGFTGVVVARIDYLTGCTQYRLQPQSLHEGKPVDGFWFDDIVLQPCHDAAPVELVKPEFAGAFPPGGPVVAMPKPVHP